MTQNDTKNWNYDENSKLIFKSNSLGLKMGDYYRNIILKNLDTLHNKKLTQSKFVKKMAGLNIADLGCGFGFVLKSEFIKKLIRNNLLKSFVSIDNHGDCVLENIKLVNLIGKIDLISFDRRGEINGYLYNYPAVVCVKLRKVDNFEGKIQSLINRKILPDGFNMEKWNRFLSKNNQNANETAEEFLVRMYPVYCQKHQENVDYILKLE